MKYHPITKWSIFLITIIFIISFSLISTHEGDLRVGCSFVLAKGKKTGPPAHAKAHGYRAKHTYRYYPSANAYYDVERKSYFYLEGNNWRAGVSLPDNLNVRLGNYVTIGMDSDKPYTSFEAHRRQYQ
jgi:hypothetical protein